MPSTNPRSPIPNEIGYTAFEHFRIELLGVEADLGRVVCPAVEAAHQIGQRLGGLFCEVLARDAGQDRLQRAAGPVGYHRAAGSLGLQGGDAEVFLAGKDEALAIRVELL